jgi:hypothetical protein
VDTLLTVYLGDQVYENDDRQAGDLSSAILLAPYHAYDVEAMIVVSNRGEYGPSQAYTLLVHEIVPTPTTTLPATVAPTGTASPSSTPITPTATPTTAPTLAATGTSTPTPTLTQAPSITPTPTFDLRDAQEPDDYAPRPIVVGQTYNYNFYPDYDIDRASFVTQSGRRYRIYTSNLALDVDTQISVQVGGAIYANDNRTTGDLSSEVVIDGNGSQAQILVLNRGRYGAGQWYRLTVEDLPPEPTVTPTPTETPSSSSAALGSRRGPGLASVARAKATPTSKYVDPGATGSVQFVIVLEVEALTE